MRNPSVVFLVTLFGGTITFLVTFFVWRSSGWACGLCAFSAGLAATGFMFGHMLLLVDERLRLNRDR